MANDPSLTSVDQASMRRVMGRFCTGVVVVTTVYDHRPVGFTAQSFTSLSLDPPLVSLCVARTSSTYPKVRATGELCVNVLAGDQSELSSLFARRTGDRFAGVDHSLTAVTGSPRIDGCLAWVDCAIEAEHDAGDHVIVVGRVLDLGGPDPAPPPLLFFRGDYGLIREEES
jgi:3-hydroxy-9,10-secoandrosta-1,3,5(10)-triene-9,17-dione monooxygenase reductase component